MNDWSTSRRAEDDLLDVYVYGIENFGRLKAIDYMRDLGHVFDLIAKNPRMGRRAEAIAPGVRRHEHGRHVILYEEAANGVTILAVIHASAMRQLRL